MEPQQPEGTRQPFTSLDPNSQNSAFAPGTLVEATDGLLGRIDDSGVYAETGQPQYVAVRTDGDNRRVVLPLSALQPIEAGRVRIQLTRQQAREYSLNLNANEGQQAFNNGQEWRVPLVEERLNVEKREVEAGVVRIRKIVDEVEQNLVVPILRDDVEVQRVAVNQPLTAPAQTRQDGEWLVVPVMREMLVVEKRLMLVEEVRIRRRQVTDQKEVRDTVRQERLEIEDTSRTAAYQSQRPDDAAVSSGQ